MDNGRKGELKAYPIYLTQEGNDYIVYIPDFDINTSGSSLADAIFMARDAIGLMGMELEDEGTPIPEPFTTQVPRNEGDIQTLVDIDFGEYRRKHDNRMVKKNCTIPYYLNVEAEKRGLNFSRLLQEALLSKING